jgi:peptidoglycan/xylan/chitin deacetylase (PgdA/CDA1 family)
MIGTTLILGHSDMHSRNIAAIILIFALLCPALLASPASQETGRLEKEKTVGIVFRYDDYSSVSDYGLEAELIRLIKEKGLKLSLGVVPFMVERDETDPSPQEQLALGGEKADLLKHGLEEGCIEVALHGYSHQTFKRYVVGTFSEFRGMPYEAQLEKITSGKTYLEDILGLDSPLQVFIPPFNFYDRNTMKAVEEAGFTVLSSALYSLSDKQRNLVILPETIDLIGFRSAVVSAEKSSCAGSVIVVLFHPYDFMEIDPERGVLTLPQFTALLDWVSSRPGIQSLFISEAARNPSFDTALFRKNKVYYLTYRLIWPQIRQLLGISSGFYICPPELRRLQAQVWVILVVYGLVLLAAVAFVSRMMFGYLLARLWIPGLFLFAVAMLLGAFAILYVLKDGSVTHLGLTLLLLATGTIIGGLGAVLKKNRA